MYINSDDELSYEILKIKIYKNNIISENNYLKALKISFEEKNV